MTLLRSHESAEPVESGIDDLMPETDEGADTPSRAAAWRHGVAIALVAVVAVAVTVALFQGPIQELWYRNRQHQLAADMNAARPGVAPGQAIAVLQVPRLGINTVVVEGDNPERLRNGPGHRVGTPPPGALGNSVIVGHRSAWGGPFASLHKVRRGDLIAVQTRKKQTIVYKVTAEARVGGADARLLRQTKDHRLTLITGRGGSFSDDWLVVTAVSGNARPATSTFEPLSAVSPSGSLIFNLTLLIALGAFGAAAAAFVYLRRRSARTVTVGLVIAPLVALGALCLLLNLDLLLPPLV